MIKTFALLFLILPATVSAETASAELRFKVEKQAGQVRFTAIGNPSALRIEGKGEGPEGKLIARAAEGKSVDLSGALTFSVSTLESGMPLRDRHMKEKYLETEKFSNATLALSSVRIPAAALESPQESAFPFSGELILHGVKRPVSGTAAVAKIDGAVKVKAAFRLKLQDHQIAIPSFAGITVADEVDVQAEFPAQNSEKM